MTHGLAGYRRHGCHCGICTAAQREAMRVYRDGGPMPVVRHGTRSCYVTRRCRRPECTQANRDYQRAYMRLYRAGVSWTDPAVESALK